MASELCQRKSSRSKQVVMLIMTIIRSQYHQDGKQFYSIKKNSTNLQSREKTKIDSDVHYTAYFHEFAKLFLARSSSLPLEPK